MGMSVTHQDCSSRSSSLRATPGASRPMSLRNLRFVPDHNWTLPAVIKCMRLVIIEQGSQIFRETNGPLLIPIMSPSGTRV
jgi:hypothetical protein